MDKFVNMLLMKLSQKYKVSYNEQRTYNKEIKISNYVIKLYDYVEEKDKYTCIRTIFAKNKTELILKLKGLI